MAYLITLSAIRTLTLTIALTLHPDVVTQQCAEHEILLRGELIERFGHYQAYRIHALLASEEEVQPIIAHGLNDVRDVLTLQPPDSELLILLVEGVEHHLAHPFLVFVDMVHENLQIDWCHFFTALRAAL